MTASPKQRSTDRWYNNGGVTAVYRIALAASMTAALTWLWESRSVFTGLEKTLIGFERRLDAADHRIDGIEERVRFVERRDR